MHVPYYDVLEQFRLIYEIVYVQKATLFVKKSQVLKVAKSRNVSENFKTGSRGDLLRVRNANFVSKILVIITGLGGPELGS